MAWLLREGEVLASIEVISSPLAKARGMAGHDGSEVVLLCAPARMAHTIGVSFPVDIAFLDSDFAVLATTHMKPNRMSARPSARAVLQAESGAFERWKLRCGDQLEVRD